MLRHEVATVAQGAEERAIKVLLFGDQRLLADSVAALIDHEVDMHVIWHGSWRPDSARRAAALKPDVILIDFQQSGYTAAGVARAVWRAGSRARVVFLVPTETDASIITALEVGASAVVDASRPAADLITKVRSVARGLSDISSLEIARALKQRRLDLDLRNSITHREMEILEQLAAGVGSREMADRLGISYTTVRTHLRNLAGKLSAHNKLEVLIKARQCGLITDSSPPPARRRVRVPLRRPLVIPPIESTPAWA